MVLRLKKNANNETVKFSEKNKNKRINVTI